MNIVNPYIFAPPVDLSTNTYIGGVASTISTASLLASKLGISVGAISNFTVVGSDIKCKITGSYPIPVNAFNGDTNVSSYVDSDNLVSDILANAFQGTTKLFDLEFRGVVTLTGYRSFQNSKIRRISLPNCLTVPNEFFSENFSYHLISIPKCTSLGVSVALNNVFNAYSFYYNEFTLIVPIALATCNSGLPDGDITNILAKDARVVYSTSLSSPNPISDLAVGDIYNSAAELTFTPPTGSVNAIEFYDIYINDVFSNRIKSTGGYVSNLTPNTNYNGRVRVYAVDVFGNKSSVSNSVNFTTTNYSYTDTDAIAFISAKNLSRPSSIESDYIFVTQLKSNSLWPKIQAAYSFNGETSSQNKYNSKNPVDSDAGFRLTFVGDGLFDELGYHTNRGGYANTYFVPSVNQAANSNGVTIVCGTNNSAASADVVELGSFNSGAQKSLITVKNNNTDYAKVLGLNSSNISITGTNESKGIFTGTKQSSTVTDLFINGVQEGTVSSGGTLPTYNIFIGCMNLTGTPYGYSSQRIQAVLFHEGLSDSETTTLYSILDLIASINGNKTW